MYGRVLMLTGLVLEKMNQTREALVYYRKARRQFNQCLGDDGAEADESDEEDVGERERERKRTGGGDGTRVGMVVGVMGVSQCPPPLKTRVCWTHST